MQLLKNFLLKIFCLSFVFIIISGCKKATLLSGNRYEKAPVSPVVFYGKEPSPKMAKSGETVTFLVKGLKSLGEFSFLISQAEAEVVNFTDSLITVKVPLNAVTGPGTVLTKDGQFFYGPDLNISGKVAIDPDFEAGNGTNGAIYDMFSNEVAGQYIFVGAFTDYKGLKASNMINGIMKIDKAGRVKLNDKGKLESYAAGKGMLGGTPRTLLPLNSSGSSFLIGGDIGSYGRHTISNFTRIFNNAAIDTMVIDLINPEPHTQPQNSKDTVPTFNAYVSGSVTRMFRTAGNKNIVIGNFSLFYKNYYTRAQKGVIQRDYTRMRNFLCVDDNGILDSTYNFSSATGQSGTGLNGFVNTGVQLSNGKIIVGGFFTSFNGVSANRIVALADDGTIDNIYAAAFGKGANGSIYEITHNKKTKKILVTGAFSEFNGLSVNNIVMLNEDGSIDKSFVARKFEGGNPSYAAQLNNGKILVAGTFQKYDNYMRQGFMILNSDGTLAEGYNNTGSFSGNISGMYETRSLQGLPAVLLYGNFTVFNNKRAGNIIQITLQP